MRIGIHLANWGPWASPAAIAALAQRAEALGFDSVWVSDHVVAPVASASSYPYRPQSGLTPDRAATHYEPLVTLAYVAGLTQRVRLGTSVLIVPLRNPVYTAKLIATLDALSGGRVILGVGVGWLAEEFRALEAAPFAQRGAVLEEYLRLYQALWSDDVTTFAGAYYRLDPVRAYPKPIQQPHPPLWFGGHSRPALRRAVRYGEGWHPVRISPATLREAMGELRRFAEEQQRDLAGFAVAVRCDIGIGLPADNAQGWQLFGPADVVAEQLARYQEAGCTDLMAELHPRETTAQMLEAMERLAEVAQPVAGQ